MYIEEYLDRELRKGIERGRDREGETVKVGEREEEGDIEEGRERERKRRERFCYGI